MTEFQTLLTQIQVFLANMLLPSRLYQIAIAIALFAVAQMINMFIAPRLHAWMRNLEDRPKWQLRWLVVLHRRLYLIIFVLLIWTVIAFMREVLNTFPSRTFLLSIIGTIAVAWLAIAMIARLIRNRFMRRLATWGGWAYVTLYYLGFIEATSDLLDNVAIEFGDFRLSAFGILKALVVTGLLFFIARLVSTQSTNQIEKNQDISPSMRVLMVKFLQIVLYGAAFFIGLKAVGFDLTGLAVLSGAIGVGLGFGLQKIASNFISGVILLLEGQATVGDYVELDGGEAGTIVKMTARAAILETYDGRWIVVPNEDFITTRVVNYSDSGSANRYEAPFSVSYDTDINLVPAIVEQAVSKHPEVLTKPFPADCELRGFGDSGVDFAVEFWVNGIDDGRNKFTSDVLFLIWNALKEHNIEIPYPQRVVELKGEISTRAK